jgi:hypothetical protein
MQPIPSTRGAHGLGAFRTPMLLALVSAIGLLSALFADGVWDVLSWAALGTPVAVIAWYVTWPVRRRRRSLGASRPCMPPRESR